MHNETNVQTTPVDWDFIIKTIQRQKCVLFLGPEIFTGANGQTLQRDFFRKMAADNPDKILAYNESDGFFLFASPQAKTRIFFQISEFFEQSTHNDLMDKIADIPFHVVVSLNPDVFLCNVLKNKGFPFAFEYYDHKTKKDIADAPTKDIPLIYNLFGAVTDPDSMVLTHDDLFHYFKAQMGNVEIPLELRSALESAFNYIFLGFEFDKWYIQLLLSLLGLQDEKYKFNRFASNIKMRPDLATLCVKHFKIEFVPNNVADFVNDLHQRCQKLDILRKPAANFGQQMLGDLKDNRAQQLKNQLEREYKLLEDLERKLGLESDPRTIMKMEDEIDRVKEQIAKYETELKTL